MSSPGLATHLYHFQLRRCCAPLVILHQTIFQLNSSKLIKFRNVLEGWIIDGTLTWNHTHLCVQHLSYYYRPSTKLREGNVFSHICLSKEGRGSHVTNNYDALWTSLYRCPTPHPSLLWPRPHWTGTSWPQPSPGDGTSLDRDPQSHPLDM